jgi:RNA polymerase sigma-70 factor (ECF subfamily)
VGVANYAQRIVDHFRSARPSEPLPEDLSKAAENGADAPDLNTCVRRFVGKSPPAYRDSLIVPEWQGLTQEEMARKLGLSDSGAKSRAQRARSQLKDLLLDCCRFKIEGRGNVLEMHPRRKA